ncbi:MAG TPA: Glu-tRNA(Gln) amidotransferase subunit GatD [Thermoplasmataceae archaeon]|nr:Glu-tRNA(Gln) amidotransferase subunit GatD [Thermoplasmatales archaeon AK]HLH86792.1 Glu-tRNA(Gln) amidotransferase subunit GatD [Thermoplasmataceae archaeon]
MHKELRQGNRLSLTFRGIRFEGTVVTSGNGLLTIKLRNGYNITVPVEEAIIESVTESAPFQQEKPELLEIENPDLTIIATGGTIASRVDYSTGAVYPVLEPESLIENVPELAESKISVHAMEPLLSENIGPDQWMNISNRVRMSMEKSRGVIVLHGTDTMAYTASAVAFMFEQQTAPVVFVGSQRSSDRPSSDAFSNLSASILFAREDLGETGICMHGGLNDSDITLIRAVRARKMHSSRRDAFKSIGEAPIGRLADRFVSLTGAKRRGDKIRWSGKMKDSSTLVYFHPALQGKDVAEMGQGKEALIIMGTGLGHVSKRLYGPIKELISSGTSVFMTTQCIYGSVNLEVYSTGRELLEMGVIPLYNMLPEVALVKSMYLLGNYDRTLLNDLMRQNLRGEVLERELI